MPRRIKKYDEAIERYGLEKIKDLGKFFGRSTNLFRKILKYHAEKEKEKKIISAIEKNLIVRKKIVHFVKDLRISRPSYYRLYNKHKRQIISIKH